MNHLSIPSRAGVAAVALGVAIAWTPLAARAERSRFYNLEGFGSWLDGNPETTAVTEEGEIVLATSARERFSDPSATFGTAAVLGEEIIVSRNDDGRILAVDRAGKTRELFRVQEGMATAMATAGNVIYIAAGSPPKIYRIDAKGNATELYTPDASYVWDIAVAKDGSLYLATGEPGQVVKVSPNGRDAQVLFAPEQEHLRCITVDPTLGIFVGGGERGVVYRAPANDERAFHALFDTGHPEITGIVVHDGAVYVAGVTGAGALASEEGNEQQGTKPGKGPEVRSQLARVSLDGTAEVLAGSNDEAIFDVAIDDRGNVVVATGATGRDDPRGRLYTIEPKQRLIAMVYQSPSRRITHLLPLPRGAMGAVTAGGGRILHFAGGIAEKGEFLTNPFDAGISSRFGILQLFADLPAGTKVTGAVRTGQTAKPDDSWSPWSKEVAVPGNVRPTVDNGRYVQVRLTLQGNGQASPKVARVRLAFVRSNLRPFVREVVALRKGYALLPIVREEPKSKSVNLADKGHDHDDGDDDKKTSQARQVESAGALTVRWVAEDPNGDNLKYDLQVRQLEHADWRTLKGDLDLPFFTLQASQLPDGHYQFRVRATDAPSNPDGAAQSDSRESQTVLIDNNPPQVDALKVEIRGQRATVRTAVADAVGPLTDATYALDGDEPHMLAPDDGVLDGPGETFTIRLGELKPGRHTLTVLVEDEGQNVGHGETSFDIK